MWMSCWRHSQLLLLQQTSGLGGSLNKLAKCPTDSHHTSNLCMNCPGNTLELSPVLLNCAINFSQQKSVNNQWYKITMFLIYVSQITRSKNRWRFNLKDGIMNINGRDYVFQKAIGEAEWWTVSFHIFPNEHRIFGSIRVRGAWLARTCRRFRNDNLITVKIQTNVTHY